MCGPKNYWYRLLYRGIGRVEIKSQIQGHNPEIERVQIGNFFGHQGYDANRDVGFTYRCECTYQEENSA